MTGSERRCAWKAGLGLAALLLAFGCRTLQPVPSQGGATWRELTSEHFVLYTDLGASEARELSLELERLLIAYLQLGWKAKGKIPLKLNVVVFANQAEYQQISPKTWLGYAVYDVMFESWMVMGSASDQYPLDTLKHELNHSIAYQAIQNQPRWFAEGIATYFETAFFRDDGWFVVGMAAQRHLEVLRHLGVLVPAVLKHERNHRDPNYEARFYSTSWLLVHYLMMERSEGFAQFQERLARGERPDDAWTTSFPDLTDDRLHQLLNAYFQKGEFAAYTMPVGMVIPDTRERLMSDADVYVLRAFLHRSCPVCGESNKHLAREEIELALRADPRHLRAGFVRVFDAPDDAERMKVARALVAAHEDSFLAWLALALAELQSDRAGSEEARMAAARAVELAPKQPYALMVLALNAAANGREDEALALSKRALRLQPTNPKLLLIRYAVLVQLGRCDEVAAVLVTLGNVTHQPPADVATAAAKCVPKVVPLED